MLSNLFHRNLRARDNLELFLLAAVSSLLLLRFFLKLTGYPQVGGGTLHIAHMLYGGLFMMAAIVLMISFIGSRLQRFAALLGGIGFGIFIDELGKFITKDNNYFFRPTVGIIYAVFMALYLLFNFISRNQPTSSRGYQLNALVQLEDAILNDMDRTEKRRAKQLLAAADQDDQITQQLQAMLAAIKTVPNPDSRLQRVRERLSTSYQRFWRLRGSNQAISLIFIVEAIIFLVVIFGTVVHNLSVLTTFLQAQNYHSQLLVGQLVSSLVAAGYAIVGATRLPGSRAIGFEWFRRATLVTIFLTQFFIFTRIQFGAIPGFIVNLALLASLNFAIDQEHRSGHAYTKLAKEKKLTAKLQ